MKLNSNCARKILFEIENIPSGENLSVEKLKEKMSEFSMDDVLAVVTFFNKEGYLVVLNKASFDDNDVFRDNKIKCLTSKGYKVLDLIRSDDIWNLMKEKINNFDELSIFTIFNIANKIVSVRHNELFGLPKDLLIDTNRW